MVDRLVIVDADTLAGWRRPKASLAQLWDAVGDLRAQQPEVGVAVIADASLRHALDRDEQSRIEQEVAEGKLLYPPAGSVGGQARFLGRVVEAAERQGIEPFLVTDQRVPGVRIIRVQRDRDRWVFDLDGAAEPTVVSDRPATGRRRRSSSAA